MNIISNDIFIEVSMDIIDAKRVKKNLLLGFKVSEFCGKYVLIHKPKEKRKKKKKIGREV